ncbi:MULTISPECIES: hypothetical protein [Klebsiella]|nr:MULTISPECIES: hypothetical protein [Klebsiella]MBZ0042969.1 hypothetical protein [Klebsiella grimontii]
MTTSLLPVFSALLCLSFLLFCPCIPPSIVEGKYRSIKLGSVNQYGT